MKKSRWNPYFVHNTKHLLMNRFKLTNSRESKQIFQGIIFIVAVAMVMILLITEGVIT